MAKQEEQRVKPGDRRRKAMMQAAWELFMKKGYAAVSLDEIIRKAGGSKSSIYGFFGNKEGLLLAIIKDLTSDILQDMRLPDTEGLSSREALRQIGFALGRDILSDQGIGLYWLCVSISRRFPKIARAFYEAGPRTPQRVLAEFLKKESDAGRLRIDDPLRASEVFHALLLDYTHLAMSLNVQGPPTDKELKKIVDNAVELFLRIYGV
jgi:TetR/AcrR family transcriptional repressor of mexJK operon